MIATLPISSGLTRPLELPCKAIAIESLTGVIAIGNALDAYMPLPLLACADISLGRGSVRSRGKLTPCLGRFSAPRHS